MRTVVLMLTAICSMLTAGCPSFKEKPQIKNNAVAQLDRKACAAKVIQWCGENNWAVTDHSDAAVIATSFDPEASDFQCDDDGLGASRPQEVKMTVSFLESTGGTSGTQVHVTVVVARHSKQTSSYQGREYATQLKCYSNGSIEGKLFTVLGAAPSN